MTAIGLWLVDFDWGVDGTYERITIDFRPDFTFDSGNGGFGDWTEVDGLIAMKSDQGPRPVFAATRVGDAMTGTGTTGSGFTVVLRGRRVILPGALPDPESENGPETNPSDLTARFHQSDVASIDATDVC